MRRFGVWGCNAFFADTALLDEKNLAAVNLHDHQIKTLLFHHGYHAKRVL
jgi:hypothetical protein